jgi:hypothetical protein
VSAGKKLLVAINGSANSLRGLSFVIKRVKKDRRLGMCLLNVQPPLPRSLFVTQTMIAGYHDSKSKEALQDPVDYWRRIICTQRSLFESARRRIPL